jgi:acetate CoA/acetoacetate CoA-transferase alpha subunit
MAVSATLNVTEEMTMSKFANKVKTMDEALGKIPKEGARIMMGGFVGAGEPTCCINWLIERKISAITLITNEPGLSGFGRAMLYKHGLVREIISSHVGTTQESTDAYLNGSLEVEQFYPMGTWNEKIRAGAMGLGGVLIPVGIGILDQPGLFPALKEPKPTVELNGKKYFIEEAVFDVGDNVLILKEHAQGVSLEEIRTLTEADFIVADDFCEMRLN